MAHERKCMVCGAKYEYCSHGCKDFNPDETWRYLFHDRKCRDVYDIWQSIRGKQITEEDGVKDLKALGIEDILSSNTIVVNNIKDMLGDKNDADSKAVEVVEAEEYVEHKDTESKAEKTSRYNDHFRKDYKKK